MNFNQKTFITSTILAVLISILVVVAAIQTKNLKAEIKDTIDSHKQTDRK